MEIFKNRITKIILGILWGFGLAVIFRYACLGKNCVICPNSFVVQREIPDYSMLIGNPASLIEDYNKKKWKMLGNFGKDK